MLRNVNRQKVTRTVVSLGSTTTARLGGFPRRRKARRLRVSENLELVFHGPLRLERELDVHGVAVQRLEHLGVLEQVLEALGQVLGVAHVEVEAALLVLDQLGHASTIPASPDEAKLERVKNPHADTLYLARFTAPEFTSICPVTGQPDFARLVIDYVPDREIVESKSLKLFLGAFRNHGAFHEDCTILIARRIVDCIAPVWLRIGGYWYPRGGIPIDVFYQTGDPPAGVWLPDQNVETYRGR